MCEKCNARFAAADAEHNPVQVIVTGSNGKVEVFNLGDVLIVGRTYGSPEHVVFTHGSTEFVMERVDTLVVTAQKNAMAQAMGLSNEDLTDLEATAKKIAGAIGLDVNEMIKGFNSIESGLKF